MKLTEDNAKFDSMKTTDRSFIHDGFLLSNESARKIYHSIERLPIIDYHCHLPPQDILEDRRFVNITEAWLDGDHYKWRAMRANGIEEHFITGNASPEDKFRKWAATVPNTLRNPLYHWTHLELNRYFAIDELLSKDTAGEIYEQTTDKLSQPEMSVRNMLRHMRVEVVCTSDDPTDSLSPHKELQGSDFEIGVFPTFRPDKLFNIEDTSFFTAYLEKLREVSNIDVRSFQSLIGALEQRMDWFTSMGCFISDHALSYFHSHDFTMSGIERTFASALSGKRLDHSHAESFRSALLFELCRSYSERGWTQQFHVGAIRDNNKRMLNLLGSNSGFDSMADHSTASQMATFFSRLDEGSHLAKTIVYNLNPKDNAMIATMLSNFNDSSTPGKMQYGAPWWFLDEMNGIKKHLDDVSNYGLLSHFVGMLTDSRSFLSFPRHEYFRRILSDVLGKDVEAGYLPSNISDLQKLASSVSYFNAKRYFVLDEANAITVL